VLLVTVPDVLKEHGMSNEPMNMKVIHSFKMKGTFYPATHPSRPESNIHSIIQQYRSRGDKIGTL
jgi:hypothetical protein